MLGPLQRTKLTRSLNKEMIATAMKRNKVAALVRRVREGDPQADDLGVRQASGGRCFGWMEL